MEEKLGKTKKAHLVFRAMIGTGMGATGFQWLSDLGAFESPQAAELAAEVMAERTGLPHGVMTVFGDAERLGAKRQAVRTVRTAREMRSLGYVPRLHGYGFVQVDLDPRRRLHVFHEDLKLYGHKTRTDVHSHAFDMQSNVLCGRLRHDTYRLTDGGGMRVWEATFDGVMTLDSSLRRSESLPGDYGCETVDRFLLAGGSSYTFGAGRWHTSSCEGLTATVITKTLPPEPVNPMVLCPNNTEPDRGYRRDSADPRVLDGYLDMFLSEVGGMEM